MCIENAVSIEIEHGVGYQLFIERKKDKKTFIFSLGVFNQDADLSNINKSENESAIEYYRRLRMEYKIDKWYKAERAKAHKDMDNPGFHIFLSKSTVRYLYNILSEKRFLTPGFEDVVIKKVEYKDAYMIGDYKHYEDKLFPNCILAKERRILKDE